MANPNKYIVQHERLFLAVNGQQQHVKKGTILTLSKAVADSLGAKVNAFDESKSLDLTEEKKPKKQKLDSSLI